MTNAIIHETWHPCDFVVDANARLIAAAPEMLAALRELTIAAEAAGWDTCRYNAPILDAARDAIARATIARV